MSATVGRSQLGACSRGRRRHQGEKIHHSSNFDALLVGVEFGVGEVLTKKKGFQ